MNEVGTAAIGLALPLVAGFMCILFYVTVLDSDFWRYGRDNWVSILLISFVISVPLLLLLHSLRANVLVSVSEETLERTTSLMGLFMAGSGGAFLCAGLAGITLSEKKYGFSLAFLAGAIYLFNFVNSEQLAVLIEADYDPQLNNFGGFFAVSLFMLVATPTVTFFLTPLRFRYGIVRSNEA